MNYLLLGLITLLSGLAVLGVVFRLYPGLQLMDRPHVYGHKRGAVPYSVGIAIFLIFCVISVFVLNVDRNLLVLLVSASLLVIISFADDYKNINPLLRLLVQLICSAGAVYSGAQVFEISNPFGIDPVQLGPISFVLSVAWIVLLTNLLNFLDGVSGLSSGVAAVGFFVIFGLSIWPDRHIVDQTLVSHMALTLGCLSLMSAVFEIPSPKILVGDSGAMFFGFMLGVLSLINGGKLATVGLVLLVPIFDGLWAVSRRLYSGKSPFKGDLGHLHHRLLDAGVSERTLLTFYYSMSILFGVIALFSWNTFFKVVTLIILFIGSALLAYFLWIREKK